jgi:hypothetical protein
MLVLGDLAIVGRVEGRGLEQVLGVEDPAGLVHDDERGGDALHPTFVQARPHDEQVRVVSAIDRAGAETARTSQCSELG